MFKFIKVLAVIGGLCSLTACTVARGVVTDKVTGEPITSAQVSIVGNSVLANQFGEYDVRALFVFPWDDMTIIATAPGYDMHTQAVADRGDTVNIALTPKDAENGSRGNSGGSSINNAPNIIISGLPAQVTRRR